ncbi:hypothetical protein DV096_03455 [Bradymonadaceae bacterium TMQ3]|nr:hypothetical protein DV096_03455 [Bradymonadaceae bacterium TMQ3]
MGEASLCSGVFVDCLTMRPLKFVLLDMQNLAFSVCMASATSKLGARMKISLFYPRHCPMGH